MDAQTLQKRYDRLIESVRRMRAAQREYFKYRARSDLEVAKRWERETDRLITEEIKQKKSKQGEIF